MKTIKIFGLLLTGAALIVACGDDDASTTTTATSSTSGGGSGGEGGAAPKSACETYCDDVMVNCTAGNAQYSSKEHCLASCAGLPEGKAGDTAGNTVNCRIYHAGAAKTDAQTHCEHAGPGGAGLCGADCEGFCAIAMKACKTAFADEATCKTECAAFKDTVAYNATVSSGDSLACRLYHLTVASTTPDPHCMHITKASPTCK